MLSTEISLEISHDYTHTHTTLKGRPSIAASKQCSIINYISPAILTPPPALDPPKIPIMYFNCHINEINQLNILALSCGYKFWLIRKIP